MIEAFIFAFGMVIGSFLNVCIRRLPNHESMVRPGSHCPDCRAPIRPRDNIPVLSYVLLGGHCRACRARISVQYPLVELFGGALALGCYLEFGPTLAAAKWLLFCAMLLVLVFTDLRERLLPNRVNYFGLVAGLVLSPFTPTPDGRAPWIRSSPIAFGASLPAARLADSALAALLFGGFLWLTGELWFRKFGRAGMGLGDVKMMGMAGTFLGMRLSFLLLLLGSVLASVIGFGIVSGLFLFGWKRRVAERAERRGLGSALKLRWTLVRRYELPFGSYLGVTGIFLVFVSAPLFDWYLRGLGIGG